MKKLVYILFHRSMLVVLALLAQLFVIVLFLLTFSVTIELFYWICIVISMLSTLWILSTPGDPAYKIAWLILILPFPIFGGVFYLLVGGTRVSTHTQQKMKWIAMKSVDTLLPDFKGDDLQMLGEEIAGQARYLEEKAQSPLYTNTAAEYFGEGETAFAQILVELEKAERYIFLEFFIIEDGVMWGSILEVLERKAALGVEVRVLYDDIGCMFTLPRDYAKQLKERGIQCRVFNRFVPVMSIRLNNRDHRKLLIVDGRVGFTGGINLADEYINVKPRFGHWKDSTIMLEGDAVWSMTVMFLSMWDYTCGWDEDFNGFRPPISEVRPWTGFVQPYTDTPLDHEIVSQSVYLNMITRARKYIYITTPYLIIDVTTNAALCNAAKMGIDVRLIVPHIPDKKYVFQVTKAHYPPLLEAGVKIYEYTPGFIHAKNFVVDGKYATVGTVNLDYRSLFLHFEDGVLLYEAPCIADITKDFLETQEVSEAVSLTNSRRLDIITHVYRSVLRIFAPLM